MQVIMNPKDTIKLILDCSKKPIDFSQYEDEILKPITHLNQPKWKHLLFDAFNYWFDIPIEKLKVTREIFNYIYDIPAIVAHIIDDAKIAQGVPTPNVVYRIPATIISCEYGNFKLFEKVLQLNNAEALNCLINYGMYSYYGQAVDVYYRDNQCTNLSNYLMMVKSKTCSGVKFCAKLIQSLSRNKTDYDEIFDLLGFYGQWLNDYRNLFKAEKDNEDDFFARELTEGKLTFPLIHAVYFSKNQEVLDILKERPKDLVTKRRCVQILKDIGTQKYCQDVMKDLGDILKDKIREVGGNPILEAVIGFAYRLHI